MKKEVKSGKEVLDDFFKNIEKIDGVDQKIAKLLAKLYEEDKLSDTNVKNALENLRNESEN